MPKITNHQHKILGHYHSLVVFYNTTKLFYYKIPQDHPVEEIQRSQGLRLTGHTSEQSLRNELRDGIEQFHELKKQTTKVIRLWVKVGGSLYWVPMRDSDGNVMRGHKRGNPEIRGVGDLGIMEGLGFQWDVLFKVKTDKTRYYQCEEGDKMGSSFSRNPRGQFEERKGGVYEFEWTAEREMFLMEMAEQTRTLGRRMAKFFQDGERLGNLLEKMVPSTHLLGTPTPPQSPQEGLGEIWFTNCRNTLMGLHIETAILTEREAELFTYVFNTLVKMRFDLVEDGVFYHGGRCSCQLFINDEKWDTLPDQEQSLDWYLEDLNRIIDWSGDTLRTPPELGEYMTPPEGFSLSDRFQVQPIQSTES